MGGIPDTLLGVRIVANPRRLTIPQSGEGFPGLTPAPRLLLESRM
jgi:hypothetical protein